MGDVQSMSFVMGPPKPGGSIYGNMVGVMKVKNSRQYMANYQEVIEGMTALMKKSGVDFPFVQETKKVKIDDLDGLELTMDMSAMIKKMPNPATAKMMQMMFGSEGKLKIYLGPDRRHDRRDELRQFRQHLPSEVRLRASRKRVWPPSRASRKRPSCFRPAPSGSAMSVPRDSSTSRLAMVAKRCCLRAKPCLRFRPSRKPRRSESERKCRPRAWT